MNYLLNRLLSLVSLYSLLLSLSGSATHNVVNSQDHLGGLGSGDEGLLLNTEALSHTKSDHVVDFAFEHVNAGVLIAVVDFRAQISHDLSSVVTTVLTNNSGQLSKGTCKCLNSDSLLAAHGEGELVNSEGHSHL